MIVDIINKVLILLFFMAILNTIRHGYYFIQAFVASTNEEPVKYRLVPISLAILGVSISYILTMIFTGITI